MSTIRRNHEEVADMAKTIARYLGQYGNHAYIFNDGTIEIIYDPGYRSSIDINLLRGTPGVRQTKEEVFSIRSMSYDWEDHLTYRPGRWVNHITEIYPDAKSAESLENQRLQEEYEARFADIDDSDIFPNSQ